MASNLSEEDWNTIEQWLEDESFINWAKQRNDQDVSKWESYFNIHPQQWKLAKVGRSLILGVAFKEIRKNKVKGQEALASLMGQLGNTKIIESNTVLSSSRSVSRPYWAAACLAFFLVISGAAYWQFFYNPGVLIATTFGQQGEAILPDGSVVILNANSKLKYWKQDPRKVWLEGEAFFEVEEKPETADEFQVVTQDLLVTVLGTSFNVNTRNDQTEVFLEKGTVLLDIAHRYESSIEMNPGDLVIYSQEDDLLQEHRKDASALETASWKEGALIFKNVPLLEALFEIEDIYGIQFIIQTDDLLRETITGGVPIRNLQVTLSTLTEVYGIQMKAIGKRYFITGRTQ